MINCSKSQSKFFGDLEHVEGCAFFFNKMLILLQLISIQAFDDENLSVSISELTVLLNFKQDMLLFSRKKQTKKGIKIRANLKCRQ